MDLLAAVETFYYQGTERPRESVLAPSAAQGHQCDYILDSGATEWPLGGVSEVVLSQSKISAVHDAR
jgi:hypothetical protein